MELANEDATMEMEHRTTYLATVGTLGTDDRPCGNRLRHDPGLPGHRTAGRSPQASQLAAGISTALFATLEGIAISIPAIFFYSMFRNRIARLSLEVAMAAEPLLEQFVPEFALRSQALPAAPHPQPPSPMPMGGPPSHPHPFAVSTALRYPGHGNPRSALPPATSESP